ncbi:hypothetical protein B9Z65_8002 [Elsinoe australis]|uniref:F-box domain-containing protein n=1 Tax=Elsinoe australis TaxID=40998 RepID=A0A2P7YVR5_9PEZI|nr:hypothetical protein B9Z65_8002 [Elsinoe australis]
MPLIKDNPTPASQVLSNEYLLEKILIRVGVKDLVVNANSTCKAFRLTIENSTKIQKKLFLLPDPRPRRLEFPSCPFKANDRFADGTHDRCKLCRAAKKTARPTARKEAFPAFRSTSVTPWSPDRSWRHPTARRIPHQLHKDHADKKSTWKNMHLTQPPTRRVKLSCFGRAKKHSVQLEDDAGITLDAIVDAARKCYDRPEAREDASLPFKFTEEADGAWFVTPRHDELEDNDNEELHNGVMVYTAVVGEVAADFKNFYKGGKVLPRFKKGRSKHEIQESVEGASEVTDESATE